MNRRLFLQFPLVAGAMAAGAQTPQAADVRTPRADPPKRGFKVGNGQDRNMHGLDIVGGRFDCKVSSKDTAGKLLIYDTVREEKGGPALHLHYDQDEWFYVMSGEFIMKVGEDLIHLKAGDSAFGPRRVPHAFAKISEGPAKVMILFQPAGSMEDFFHEVAKIGKGVPTDQVKMKELFRTHGMELVGPPLKF